MEPKKTRVLLAEDDPSLGVLLRDYLKAKNYDVELCKDGERAYRAFRNSLFDICVLDVMMPLMDGFTLAKEIRLVDEEMPILFLTAKSLKEDVIEGFAIGADDYMTKPFSIEEMLLRMEAILRRSKKDFAPESQDVFQLGRYEFNYTKQTLTLDTGKVHKLTARECELMKSLCVNKNSLLNRSYALKTIWADDSYFNARSMDVYITKLRKYLKDDPTVEIINVRGKGFKIIY